MRGVERLSALLCPEAFRSGSRVTVKDKEVNALRNLARLTSLVIIVDHVSNEIMMEKSKS